MERTVVFATHITSSLNTAPYGTDIKGQIALFAAQSLFMTIKIFCASLFLLFCLNTHAQLDISVDPVTGSPGISIPLWEFSCNDLSVPIALVHHGSSMKMTEGTGAVGVGWNLAGIGGVYRETRGLPDDYLGTGEDSRKGWLFNSNATTIHNFAPSADDNLTACNDEQADWNFLNNFGFTNDPEPDVFSFRAPGLSGNFVFGRDGMPKLLSYQDIAISVGRSPDGKISTFDITTNTGVVYNFVLSSLSKRQKDWYKKTNVPNYFTSAYQYFNAPLTFGTEWALSKITSPNGAAVTYNYSATEKLTTAEHITAITEAGVGDTLYYIKDQFSASRIASIEAGIYNVDFSWSNDRLSEIKILDTQLNNSKVFKLVYQGKSGSVAGFGTTQWVSRSFLSEVRIEDNCTPLPSYAFEYSYFDVVPMPWVWMISRDIWGYFNNVAQSNIPTVYFYANATGSERFRTELNSSSTPTNTLGGANRQANVYSSFGALSRINYPSGGNTTITYEPHTYFDALANSDFNANGVRVKSIISVGGELAFGSQIPSLVNNFHTTVKNYEYDDINGKSSGRITYHPVYAFADGTSILRTANDLAPEPIQVLYKRVTEKTPSRGKRVFEYALKGMYPETVNGDWSATVSKVARNAATGCVALTNVKNGAYTFPFPLNTNFDFERALLNKVSEYSENGTLMGEQTFKYKRVPSTAYVVKGLRLEKIGSVFHYGVYTLLTGLKNVMWEETSKTVDDVTLNSFHTTVTTYQYNTSHYLLDAITHTNSDGALLKEKIKYAKDFATITNPSGDAAVALKTLNITSRHGLVVESVKTVTPAGGTETVQAANLTLFKDFGSNKVYPSQTLSFTQNVSFSDAYVKTVGTSQEFAFDTDYILPVDFIFDDRGNILTQSDSRKNVKAFHYGFSKTSPIAFITNAKASEVVYEGFETSTGYGLTLSTSPGTYSAGWTGQRALQQGSTLTLERTNIDKGASVYRASCWVKAASVATVSFKVFNGATLVTSKDVSYTAADLNKWKYLETLIDITSGPSPFTLRVVTTATVQIDDIVLLPAKATINTRTIKPLFGTTSETDDRGFSFTREFDAWGRLIKTFDRERNLVEVKEYQSQRQGIVKLDALYEYEANNRARNDLNVGQVVTFTAPVQCVSPVTFSWKINGQEISTSASFNYTFNSVGSFAVSLTVTSPSYDTESVSSTFCIYPTPLDISFLVSNGNSFGECDPSYDKTFIAPIPTSACSPSPGTATYKWYFRVSGGDWIELPELTRTLVFNISGRSLPIQSYTIRCDIVVTCTSPLQGAGCEDVFGTITGTGQVNINYVDSPTPCP